MRSGIGVPGQVRQKPVPHAAPLDSCKSLGCQMCHPAPLHLRDKMGAVGFLPGTLLGLAVWPECISTVLSGFDVAGFTFTQGTGVFQLELGFCLQRELIHVLL